MTESNFKQYFNRMVHNLSPRQRKDMWIYLLFRNPQFMESLELTPKYVDSYRQSLEQTRIRLREARKELDRIMEQDTVIPQWRETADVYHEWRTKLEERIFRNPAVNETHEASWRRHDNRLKSLMRELMTLDPDTLRREGYFKELEGLVSNSLRVLETQPGYAARITGPMIGALEDKIKSRLAARERADKIARGMFRVLERRLRPLFNKDATTLRTVLLPKEQTIFDLRTAVESMYGDSPERYPKRLPRQERSRIIERLLALDKPYLDKLSGPLRRRRGIDREPEAELDRNAQSDREVRSAA